MSEDHQSEGEFTVEVGSPSDARGDGLLGRIEVIEAQPLDQRAAGYDQLAEELLSELQRSDHEASE